MRPTGTESDLRGQTGSPYLTECEYDRGREHERNQTGNRVFTEVGVIRSVGRSESRPRGRRYVGRIKYGPEWR